MTEEKIIRRINLFGGPGTGKSATAHGLIRELMLAHVGTVGFAHEYVKKLAYQGVPIEGVLQIKAFSKQMTIEADQLDNGVGIVVSDSPLLLQPFYAKQRGEEFWTSLVKEADWFEWRYPSLNILLDPEGVPYQEEGRYQNKEEAKRVHSELAIFLIEQNIKFQEWKTLDYDKMVTNLKYRFVTQYQSQRKSSC